MKKSFSACFFAVLVGLSMSPAFAFDTELAVKKTNHLNLQEITLDNEHNDSFSVNNSLASENSVTTVDAIPLESSLENKQSSPKSDDNRGFLSIFNLKGGVQKSSTNEESQAEEKKSAVEDWLHGDYATGKWFGARPLFEDHGVSIQSSLLYSPFFMTRGGMNDSRSGKAYSLFNLGVTIDTEKAHMWKGGTFYALYQNKRGYGLSAGSMGDWIGLDGWDWREMNQISECWYQQKLFNDKVRLKFGKQDGNTDFAFLNSGWDFMNTGHSINPTVPLPTYPDQAFGFMVEVSPKEWLSLKNGTYSRFNVPFNISEIEFKPTIRKLPGRYILGAWELSDSNGMEVASSYDPVADETYVNNFHRNFGFYAGFEQMVYKENKDDDEDMQGLTVFCQYGMSPSNRNDMSSYVGGGLHYRGLIPKRDQDIAGVAVASGAFARRLGDITSQVGSENSIEAFYRVQVTPWFYLQPDVQFIMNPSGCYDNSVAIGIRSVITF